MLLIRTLLIKDLRIDFRNKYPLLATVSFLLSISYICYLSFQGGITTNLWNSLLWVIILFTLLVAIGKSFSQEYDRSLYYYFVCKPSDVIASKLIFNGLYAITLTTLTYIILNFFFPIKGEVGTAFLLCLFLGTTGLAMAFTLISSISSVSGSSYLMAVLGFPISIPVILLAVTNSKKALLGAELIDIRGGLITLISVDVIIFALVYILFPYSWKK